MRPGSKLAAPYDRLAQSKSRRSDVIAEDRAGEAQAVIGLEE